MRIKTKIKIMIVIMSSLLEKAYKYLNSFTRLKLFSWRNTTYGETALSLSLSLSLSVCVCVCVCLELKINGDLQTVQKWVAFREDAILNTVHSLMALPTYFSYQHISTK